MSSFGSEELSREEIIERNWKRRESELTDVDSFSTYIVISYNKLKRLNRKEKQFIIKEHHDLFNGTYSKNILKVLREDFNKESLKIKIMLVVITPFFVPSVLLSDRNLKKFKDENLELFL